MRQRGMDDFFGDAGITRKTSFANRNFDPSTVSDGIPGSVTPGSLTSDSGEAFLVHLTAGVTYSFAERPTATGGIRDPLLMLFDGLGNFITYDDDGGKGTSSILSYTPTADGDFYIYASSWVNEESTGGDRGGFEIFQWDSTQPDAGDTLATAMSITTGTTFGSELSRADIDMYTINLAAGQFYQFNYSGGFDGAGEPGVVARISLLDAAGNVVVTNLAAESGMGYLNNVAGTYYVKIAPHSSAGAAKGGYTLDVKGYDLATADPLEAIRWKSANNLPSVDVDGQQTVYIYFAPAGVNYGQVEPDGPNAGQPMGTYGWQQFQIDGVMSAIQTNYTPITGLHYVQTTNESQAQVKIVTTTNLTFGARFYPQDPANGSLQGVAAFNLNSGGFGVNDGNLLRGGFSYAVVLHEFGHGHGLAHPHDNGGGSDIMLGVSGSTGPASYGVYNLNQGVYTVMSYNDGWPTDPDGTRAYSAANRTSGWSGSLSAFDIAVLQERYGVHANATGNDTYTLSDTQAGAMYQCIWDSGGTDTIAYAGTKNVQIDLSAATLHYEPNGGGALSFAHGVFGGYTIAHNVVIENATGGDGADLLIGNSANNVLTGNGGADTLAGRTGLDVYRTGAGADTVIMSLDNGKVDTKMGSVAYDIITDFDGTTDKIDFSDLDAKVGTSTNDAFSWIGTNANKSAGQLSYKVFDSMNGAEKALGIEISDFSGPHSGPITVVMANVDGGGVDYAVVLLGAPVLSAADFSL